MGKKNLTFKTELNGYKKCEVDERLQKDARRIEVLEAQVALVDGLKDENQRLASEVEKYKKCEDEVKNVLAVATKKAFDIKTDMKLQYALETERLKIFKAKWTSAYDELKRKYGFDTDAAIRRKHGYRRVLENRGYSQQRFRDTTDRRRHRRRKTTYGRSGQTFNQSGRNK